MRSNFPDTNGRVLVERPAALAVSALQPAAHEVFVRHGFHRSDGRDTFHPAWANAVRRAMTTQFVELE